MKSEREIAELIFEKFRSRSAKVGHVIMLSVLRSGLIENLIPKERELFDTVLFGLIYTYYFTYEASSKPSICLTEKGYDYIYDHEKVQVMLQKPWIIPSFTNTDWDNAFNNLWKVIGPLESASHYIVGSQFYELIRQLSNALPVKYSFFIDSRRKDNLSINRSIYYKDLIQQLEEERRMQLYANIQLFVEEDSYLIQPFVDEIKIYDNLNNLSSISLKKEANQNQEKAELITVNQNDSFPTVFISYSWDNEEHENWVLDLATKLLKNGVNAILDKWDLGALGKPLPDFMDNAIAKSQRVVCVMTPNYKTKTVNLKGGVGYEYSIISAEIMDNIITSKFIPLLRSGNDTDAIPTALKGRKYVDMRDDSHFEEKFMHELLRDIHEEPKFKKPQMGPKPNFD